MTRGKAVTLSTGSTHKARKRFAQNFLHDQPVIDSIIQQIAPTKDHHLIEIGPGQGALTERLAASGARLDCIELDRDLAAHLTKLYRHSGNVHIHQQDVLKFDLDQLITDNKPVRLIGNLPYNISTPVLFHLFKYSQKIRDMHFMLQLEVVQRMSAQPGGKNYGRLSLMLQYFCAAEKLFDVPPHAFTPQPKVNSAIVRLTPHRHPTVIAKDLDSLALVVRTAFSQRRKTLKNSMKALLSEDALSALGIDLRLRPEKLNLADYVTISDALGETAPQEKNSDSN